MSYIRAAWPLKYVKGFSEDYVFGTEEDGEKCIVDYGSISDNGIVELLFEEWETEDTLFKEHLLCRLADRLGVELRETPLTDDEIEEEMTKSCEIYEELIDTIQKIKKSNLDENAKKFIFRNMTMDNIHKQIIR